MDDSFDFVMVVERDKTLTEAVFNEDLSLVQEILEKGTVDLNEVDSNGRSVIFCAVNRGNSELVKILLNYGADTRMIDKYGNTVLHWCGSLEILNLLILYGADIFAKNQGGLTPKMMAIRRGVGQSVIEEYNLIETRLRVPKKDPVRSSSPDQRLPTLLQEFCQEMGWQNFLLLILGILFISLYVAYTITGMSRHFEYRQPIIMEGHHIKL
ncbi:hypothetical protein FSP39_013556 [Pinctada imbricata]|uniref:Ankyrin repeat domain-containing protein 46 n=1 Tax=Pinctada imbricata TaxID=66713 RepID=A0AA88YJR7_PINIB|nr:hypothetical protein FSP39_013556 [Pinctada imbricata]